MFLNLVRNRRSIRKFKPIPIEEEKINAILETVLRSPSSRNLKPLRFIVIQDADLIEKLSLAKSHGSRFLKYAPLAIAVCADPSKSDVWVEDASIASIFIHLAAHDLGLGSCWIQIRKREHTPSQTSNAYVKELLNIPDNIKIESIIAIGYPDEVKKAHSKESLLFDKVSFNSWSKE